MKRMTGLAAMVSSVAVLTASTMGVVHASAAGQPTVITMWYPWGGLDQKLTLERIAAFEKIHPDIRIQATLIQDGGVPTGKFSTAVASGDPPDLVIADNVSATPQFAAQGALTDISSAAKQVGISPSQYFPGFQQYMSYHGALYAIPHMGADYSVLLYNKKTLAAAGVSRNFVPKTLSDVERLAKKIDKIEPNGKVDRITFAPQVGYDPSGFSLVTAEDFGAKIFAANGRTPVFNTDPNFTKYVSWLKGFVTKYGAVNLKRLNNEYGTSNILSSRNNPFYTGQVAFVIDGSWVGAYAKPYMNTQDMGMVPLPPVTAGKPPVLNLDSDVYWFPKGAKHITQALEFIKFCNSPQNLSEYADLTGQTAPTQAAAKLQKIAATPLFKPLFDTLSTGKPVAVPNTPNGQWGQILSQAVYDIVYNNANIRSRLDQAAKQIQSLYNK